MELKLEDLLSIALRLSIEDLLVVATHEMATNHGLRAAHHLENVFVQRGLDDAIVELHDKHVLLNTGQLLANQFNVLHLVVIKPSAVLSDELRGLAIIFAEVVSGLLVLCWREFNDT